MLFVLFLAGCRTDSFFVAIFLLGNLFWSLASPLAVFLVMFGLAEYYEIQFKTRENVVCTQFYWTPAHLIRWVWYFFVGRQIVLVSLYLSYKSRAQIANFSINSLLRIVWLFIFRIVFIQTFHKYTHTIQAFNVCFTKNEEMVWETRINSRNKHMKRQLHAWIAKSKHIISTWFRTALWMENEWYSLYPFTPYAPQNVYHSLLCQIICCLCPLFRSK